MEPALTEPIADSDSNARRIETLDFDWIVRKYQKRIYRIVFFLVRNSEAADTLTQECFMRAFEKRESFRAEASVETWLVRIAINLAHDQAKSRKLMFWKRLVRGVEDHGIQAWDQHGSPEQQLRTREEVATVWSAAESLPAQQRMVFRLRFAEEMSLAEIAAATQLEVGTVKSHLSRALRMMREHLKRIR